MKLTLERFQFSPESTLGRLYINGQFFCYTLEDFDRKLEDGGNKVYGETCIPRGEYEVVITYSNRFKTDLPLLKDVAGFEGIRIHAGNTNENTEGCLLVGTGYSPDRLFNSRVALAGLLQKLESAYEKGDEITIEVK